LDQVTIGLEERYLPSGLAAAGCWTGMRFHAVLLAEELQGRGGCWRRVGR